MNKVYDHKSVEEKIYEMWEEGGYFKPEINPNGAPFSVILPPPNANAPLHFGHAMYVLEDVMIRYNRMKGFKTLWLPGADHAGFETQFVFEKHLAAEGKSRFDFDRETLYKMIWDFVENNRGGMESQLKKLGFSLDWSRLKFTLEPDIVKIVCETFKRLFEDGLVYRSFALVNYCTFDGTSFSDLEVVSEEIQGTIYEIKYKIKDSDESITVATTRPETLFGDVAIMVNPQDTRYKDKIGKTALIPLVNREIPIIADDDVEIQFGTGAVKVTPNHDFHDYEVSRRNNLPQNLQIIGFDGKMINTGVVDGQYVKSARKMVLEKLKDSDVLVREKPHVTVLKKCYKCKNVLEPLPMEQWFISTKPLAKRAIEALRSEIDVYPKRFVDVALDFLENIRDWNISRQIVWGIRIPAYKCKKTEQWFISLESPKTCDKCGGSDFVQDTDTFDTWFSSGQWPFATLSTTNISDFEEFYPSSVMETGYDILRWWVVRMIMLGLYTTNKIPFKNIVLHGLVNDPLGKKMSKSKGNVVNPLELVETYGADSVRFALIYGTALGNDQALSYPKLEAMRKFTNKLWNMARFIEFQLSNNEKLRLEVRRVQEIGLVENNSDKEEIEKVSRLETQITGLLDSFNFNEAAQVLYEFVWHDFADIYIEDVKKRMNQESFSVLCSLYFSLIRLLHPFMPFITEEINTEMKFSSKPLIISKWI